MTESLSAWRALFAEGGLTVLSRDPDGRVVARTFVQLGGDMVVQYQPRALTDAALVAGHQRDVVAALAPFGRGPRDLSLLLGAAFSASSTSLGLVPGLLGWIDGGFTIGGVLGLTIGVAMSLGLRQQLLRLALLGVLWAGSRWLARKVSEADRQSPPP